MESRSVIVDTFGQPQAQYRKIPPVLQAPARKKSGRFAPAGKQAAEGGGAAKPPMKI
ncbi:MAG: hypothetical protein IKR48_05855 [Kiritimatiellae bacterium]|nr:hypothetical protein [Kiritimatiellia bacterium]